MEGAVLLIDLVEIAVVPRDFCVLRILRQLNSCGNLLIMLSVYFSKSMKKLTALAGGYFPVQKAYNL